MRIQAWTIALVAIAGCGDFTLQWAEAPGQQTNLAHGAVAVDATNDDCLLFQVTRPAKAGEPAVTGKGLLRLMYPADGSAKTLLDLEASYVQVDFAAQGLLVLASDPIAHPGEPGQWHLLGGPALQEVASAPAPEFNFNVELLPSPDRTRFLVDRWLQHPILLDTATLKTTAVPGNYALWLHKPDRMVVLAGAARLSVWSVPPGEVTDFSPENRKLPTQCGSGFHRNFKLMEGDRKLFCA